MENLSKYIYSEEVLSFVKQCKSYTDLLEDENPVDRNDFVVALLKIIPALYSGMIMLKVNPPVYDFDNEKFVTEEKWGMIYKKIIIQLGSQNEYLDLPEEDEFDRLDVISRELSEDLADVYQDIKDFTEVFRLGNEEVMNDVLWECRISFENYWGKKVLRASLNLHKIMMRDEEILEKMDKEYEEKSANREYSAEQWFIARRQNETGKQDGLPE